MAATILVTQVTGQAWIRGADGALTPLHQGMRIPADASVVTAEGANVQLQPEGLPVVTIGGGRDVQLGADVAEAHVDTTAAAAAPPADPAVAQVLAALNDGTDPFANLDPTAAVLAAGGGEGGGGSSFTRLASIIETTTPLGLAYPKPSYGGTDNTPLSAAAVPAEDTPAAPLLSIPDENGITVGNITVAENAAGPQAGVFQFSAPGGLASLTIGNVTLTAAQLAATSTTPVTIPTANGQITITGYDAATGTVSYQYSVGGAQNHSAGDDSVTDTIAITVTDSLGRQVSDNLGVHITDTNPTAANDAGGQLVEDAAVSGISGNVLGNDSVFDGPGTVSWTSAANTTVLEQLAQYGTVTLGADGKWSFTLDNTKPATQALAEGQVVEFSINYVVTDADGDTAQAALSFSIVGTNDVPTVTNDAQSVTEDAGVTAAGKLSVDGSVTINDVDTGEGTFNTSTLALQSTTAAGGVQLGAIALNPNGTYTYTVDNSAVQYLKAGEKIVETYTVKSADGTATSTITITINGTNDVPIIKPADSVLSVSVSEEGLARGLPSVATGETDTTNSTTATGSIAFTDADANDTHAFSLIAPSMALTSGGKALAWDLSGDGKSLIGYVMSGGARTDIIDVKINDSGVYSVKLLGPVDHSDTSKEDITSLEIGVRVTDSANESATTKITINIEDDSPQFGMVTNAVMSNEVGQLHGVLGFETGGDGFGSLKITDITGLPKDWHWDAIDASGSSVNIFAPGGVTPVYTVVLNADGSYAVTQNSVRPGASDNINLGTALANPPTGGYVFSKGDLTVTLTPIVNKNGSLAFNAADGWFGVGNTSFDTGEKFELKFSEAVTNFQLAIDTAHIKAGKVNITISDGVTTKTLTGVQIPAGAAELAVTEAQLRALGMTNFTTVTLEATDKLSVSFGVLSYTEYHAATDMSFTVNVQGQDGDHDSANASFVVTSAGGSSANNNFTGTAANEVFHGGSGTDHYDGQGGFDIVDYGDSTTTVIASLATGQGTGGDAAGDTYANIEGLFGGKGDDTLTGNDLSNLLVGGAGNDTLYGGGGNDTLRGGTGNDTMTGGAGNDTFVWGLGDQGTTGAPAVDTIKDFGLNESDLVKGKDVLDLRDLLVGENAPGADLSKFLYLKEDGSGNTVINVNSKGQLDATGGNFDQQIVLEHVHLQDLAGTGSQNQMIQQMITDGKLKVDHS